ncbi:hypothetical protein [Pseudoduganella violacea]|uniref:Uncharacterized protein n=1 Tax=Pseudoduganella violacea TaxID=1715466 RepID=A0A7W5BFU4_9BURK|nr:hypothetical protein [Pseudoduganella violacea]MBB3121500.1 hypothetical protein [Pseudoduganella violacea]
MSIKEMKARVKSMMAAKYGIPLPGNLAPREDAELEAAFFVRAQDAKVIRVVCRKSHYAISFRTAGEHTLYRINQGNPCKGHKIMTKSIKPVRAQGDAIQYSYEGLSEDDFAQFRGLVGYPVAYPEKQSGPLEGIWAIKNANGIQRMPIQEARSVQDLSGFFTGDYDMHDLLKFSHGRCNRILAGTPDEASAIDAFNSAILNEDKERKNRVTASLAATPEARLRASEYALIRHGAQTSFFSYLLGPGRHELEVPENPKFLQLEAAVNNIDPNICIFDPQGQAYILKGVAEIYSYYALNNLLDQIPFYYFFKDLRSDPLYKKELKKFSIEINSYIKGCMQEETS